MIQLVNVAKSFDEKSVLRDLTWQIQPGELWRITGSSGIGKTTLLRLVMGCESPDHGTITRQAGLRFCPVFQQDRLVESWNAYANVRLVCNERDKVAEILRNLLPEDSLTQPVRTLSGGMRRRVALARALAAPGDILVLDEPFAGLDRQTTEQSAEVLQMYANHRAILLVSHETEWLFPHWRDLHMQQDGDILIR